MQVKKKYAILLIALTLLVLLLRLAIAFSVEAPSYTSYFTIIQAEKILKTGTPLYEDPLSFQGRTYLFNPFFYYIVAFFILFIPKVLLLKLLPNLAMASLVPLVYLIAHNLTKSRGTSLITAFFAGFAPILFSTFLNEATPLSFALPLSAALFLTLLDVEAKPLPALLCTLLLTLLSPVIWLFLFTYVIYLLILTAERISINTSYMEMALITFLFAAWYTLVTYKQALFREGIAILWGSLPLTVRTTMFGDFTLLAMIYAVGVVPLALGSYALYHNAFEQRVRKIFFIAAFTLTTLGAAIFQLIPLRLALLYLSLSFLLLSAPALHNMIIYLKKMRFPRVAAITTSLLLLFFILTSLLPALSTGVWPQSSPTQNELDAMHWISENTKQDAAILAAPKSGFLINNEAKRTSIINTNYLLITNPDALIADIDQIYEAPFTVAVTELLTKHGVDYILLGPTENERFAEVGAVAKDRDCFPLVYKNPTVAIFSVKCTVARSGQ